MADKKITTTLELEAKTKGFEAAIKRAEKLREALGGKQLTGGSKALEDSLKKLEPRLAGIAKHVERMTKAMGQFEKAIGRAFAGMGTLPGAGIPGPPGGGRHPGVPGGASAARAMPTRQGSFMQGLVQGLGLVEYIKPGPGMGRQAGGALLGRGLRGAVGAGAGVIGGLSRARFTGLEGMQQAFSSLAMFGGGIAAGELHKGASAASEFIETQRAQLGLAPMLGRTRTVLGRPNAEQRRAITAAGQQAFSAQLLREENPYGPDAAGRAEAARRRAEQGATPTTRQRVGGLNYGGLIQGGIQFGAMGRQQSLQFVQELLSRGGAGTAQEAQRSGFINAAMAAKTQYGVGPEVAGAFQAATRRGGIVGAQNTQASNLMAQAIQKGIESGMDRTEVRDFLQDIAASQEEFRRTGIPVNPKSMLEMGRTFGMQGLEVGRGAFIGGALTRRAQQISAEGPQSSADFLMLQKLGGFKGGGLEELEQARLRMEQLTGEGFGAGGQGGQGGIKDLIKTIVEGSGGGAAGREALRRTFKGYGAPLGIQESILLEKRATGQELTPEEHAQVEKTQKKLLAAAKEGPKTPEELMADAARSVKDLAGSLAKQAGIESERINQGQKFVKVVQDLEQAQNASLRAFAVFAPELEKLTGIIKSLAEDLPRIAKTVHSMITGEFPMENEIRGKMNKWFGAPPTSTY